MTMIPCPKCGQKLMHDDAAMCADCEAAANAIKGAKRSAFGRKVKAVAILVVELLAALRPILKPIWEKTLAKPLTALFVILVGWSILSGPDHKQASTPSTVSSLAAANKPAPAPKEAVINSSWDGSVWQVEHYLERNLKDPGSFEAIDWFPVVKSEGTYLVRCRYRAKNSFGGYVIEDQIFQLSKEGDVIAAADFDPLGIK